MVYIWGKWFQYQKMKGKPRKSHFCDFCLYKELRKKGVALRRLFPNEFWLEIFYGVYWYPGATHEHCFLLIWLKKWFLTRPTAECVLIHDLIYYSEQQNCTRIEKYLKIDLPPTNLSNLSQFVVYLGILQQLKERQILPVGSAELLPKMLRLLKSLKSSVWKMFLLKNTNHRHAYIQTHRHANVHKK